MDLKDEILHFWFEGATDKTHINKNASPFRKWFIVDRAFDEDIRRRFEEHLAKAKGNHYKDWEDNPRGRLALIILLDQFSRNLYRNTPHMYEADEQALALTLKSIKEDMGLSLSLIERVFLYMPLMHSEDVVFQRLSVKSFEELVRSSRDFSAHNTHYYEYNLKYARDHLKIVERFGRFPHRNSILKRESTPEEIAFLNKNG